MTTSLLGVSQVTLFRSGSVPNSFENNFLFYLMCSLRFENFLIVKRVRFALTIIFLLSQVFISLKKEFSYYRACSLCFENNFYLMCSLRFENNFLTNKRVRFATKIISLLSNMFASLQYHCHNYCSTGSWERGMDGWLKISNHKCQIWGKGRKSNKFTNF